MKKNFKYIILFVTYAIICISLASCDFKSYTSKPVDQDKSESKENEDEDISDKSGAIYKTLSGVVINSENGYVSIFSKNRTFKFSVSQNKIESDSLTFILGFPATVIYSGELDAANENQTVSVKKIDVDTNYYSYEMRAKQLVDIMTTKEKIGQLFLVRCYPEKAVEDIKNLGLGGLVLFASDFDKSPDEVRSDINNYKSAAKFGLTVAVDEEGGAVVRVSKYKQFRKSPFLSPQKLYKIGGFKLIKSDTTEKAELLLSLGINVNLAPVADVPSKASGFIYDRSFGTDASLTAEYVATVVGINKEKGIGSVLKHFPGYGDNSDTHIGFSFDNKALNVFRERDFLPFKSGITAGAEAVMVSHNTVTAMDEKNPASLSKSVIGILRNELGFNGVVMTDDLSMDAVKDYINPEEVGVKAILAGNDVICTSDYEILYDSVKEAVESGEISLERIDESVMRVLVWKLKLKIIS